MARSNLSICYEGIQRIYRNAVVQHLRSRLRKAFPEDDGANLRKPFKEEEWEKMRASALERRKTGELSAELTDDFDLLGVNHFFNLFDLYYDILCEGSPIQDEGTKKIQKQALLNWMKTIKNLRDPLSHPSEQDFSFEDSFILLDCARRTLLRLKLADDAECLKKLMGELSGRPVSILSEIEPLAGRLPPRESIVVDFCGREEEIRQLWEWFQDPISRRWALAGEGGKGKTALAFKFATEVKFAAREPFQIVLWLSAKKRMFQEGRIVDRAERLLKEALRKKYVNNRDLLGFLGFVYKTWNPPRVTDAREAFKRSWQLKCSNEETYKHWCRMEIEQQEWTKGAEAADRGLQRVPKSRLLLYLAGHARSRLGKELLGAGHREKAEGELHGAQILLERALNEPASSEIREKELIGDIYRALVLNCEARRKKEEIRYYFKKWREAYPEDPNAESEWERIAGKFRF